MPITNQNLAKQNISRLQYFFIFALILVCGFIFSRSNFFEIWLVTGTVITSFFVIYVLLRIVCTFLGMHRGFSVRVTEQQLAQLEDDSLPIYTILLPIFQEPEVLESLLMAIENLDYPKSKLDIKLLLEANDRKTKEKLAGLSLPSWLQIMEIPPGVPQTKPRACNIGLSLARGEFTVVFDAEDRPERDQLKKAVLAFRSLPNSVVCLQAKLNCYNSDQNMLTRLFTLEYTAWFDLFLPGLYAIGSPIPLGGTSNHFRSVQLIQMGAWDPYNVTEDCDLGMRIAIEGFQTQVLDSTTWEEAPSVLKHWFTQRTRWQKGYLQTFFVHTRNPFSLLKRLGAWKTFLFTTVVGGQVMVLALLIPFWLQMILWIYFRWPLMIPDKPWTQWLLYAGVGLNLFNFVFIFTFFLGAYLRKKWRLALWSFCVPFYWFLTGLASWRGIFQFCFKPHFWEKTPHGLAKDDELDPRVPAQNPRPKTFERLILGASVVFALLALKSTSEFLVDFAARNCYYSNIQTREHEVSCELLVDADWSQASALNFELRIPSVKSGMTQPLDLSVLTEIEVNDGEFYQFHQKYPWPPNRELQINLPFDALWKSPNWDTEIGPWTFRKVRALRVYLQDLNSSSARDLFWASLGRFDVRNIVIDRNRLVSPFQISNLIAPEEIHFGSRFEAKFDVTPIAKNPFDPKEIEVNATIKSPRGQSSLVPAFFSQSYRLGTYPDPENAQLSKKDLIATGSPAWIIRFNPVEAGVYQWSLSARNNKGELRESPLRTLIVKEAKKSKPQKFMGPIFFPPGEKFFRDQNQKFIFPMGMNLGWPFDQRKWKEWMIPEARVDDDVEVYDRIFAEMAKNQMNFSRIWMAPWWGGLEWNKKWPSFSGLGDYSLRNAWRIEQILMAAEKHGISLILVLNGHQEFEVSSQWKFNPFNRENGGFLDSPSEVYTSPLAWNLFKQRYRYIVSRFSSYKSLFGWELWNEANAVSKDKQALINWHQQAVKFLNEIDPYHRPVGTSIRWRPKQSDLVQGLSSLQFGGVQAYNPGAGNVRIIRSRLHDFRSMDTIPLITEYGGSPFGAAAGHLAQNIHDGLWVSWVLPLPAAPLSWWWNFVSAKGLMRYFKDFSQYIRGEDLSRDDWQFIMPKTNHVGIKALARIGTAQSFLWIYSDTFDVFHADAPLGSQAHKDYMIDFYSKNKPANFDPFDSEDPGSLFNVSDISLELPQVLNGLYDVEVWDTWGKGVLHSFPFSKSEKNYELALPPIQRDVAIKMIRRNKK